jgi:hypothetical protein
MVVAPVTVNPETEEVAPELIFSEAMVSGVAAL